MSGLDYEKRVEELLTKFMAKPIQEATVVELVRLIVEQEGIESRESSRNAARVGGGLSGAGLLPVPNSNASQAAPEQSRKSWPATAPQKEALKNWHVQFEDDITKDEASRLLDEAIRKAKTK